MPLSVAGAVCGVFYSRTERSGIELPTVVESFSDNSASAPEEEKAEKRVCYLTVMFYVPSVVLCTTADCGMYRFAQLHRYD